MATSNVKNAMNAKGTLRSTAAAVSIILCCLITIALSGCSNGIAATVNGTSITEQRVTDYIDTLRAQTPSYSDDTIWASYLAQQDLTPQSLREQTIDMFAQEQLIKDYATSQGITVDEDSIEQQVSTAKESVGGTDNTWLTSLQSQGYTDEADYRDYLETTYLSHQISQTLAPTVDDATLLQAVQQNPSSLVGKRSSVIVLGTQSVQNGEDVQTLASDIENQIATGTDFAALAQSYSIDSVSAQSGGDMGWEAALKATEEAGGSGPDQTYFDTLDKLAVGQVSQPVAIADSTGAASGNYEIIKCTDEFNVPAGGVTSLSQLPQDMTSELRNGLTEYNQESAFSQWLQAQMQSADIQINDMPSNLPYDVDMSLAQSSSSSSSSGSQSSSSAGTASTGSSSSSSGSVFTGSSTGAAADGGLISTLPEGSDGN